VSGVIEPSRHGVFFFGTLKFSLKFAEVTILLLETHTHFTLPRKSTFATKFFATKF
jgi:hypothetical protein